MSKKQNESFQLKPKHLIRAAFVISIIAVGALIVGVIGTLNPKRQANTETELASQTEPKDEGVEVWRPNGTIEPKKIIINADDDAEGQGKADSQNPVIPPQNQSENRRAKAQPDAKNKEKNNGQHDQTPPAQTKITEIKTKPAPNTPAEQLQAQATAKPEAQEAKTETKIETKPAPQPAPKPASSKPQSKEVMDNLF
jgi:putative periplasmic protein